MIALKIGSDMRMAVVGSPSHFKRYGLPASPQDLATHNCIVTAAADLWRAVPMGPREGWQASESAWPRASGVQQPQLCASQSALDGLGLAYLPEDQVLPHIRKGKLVRVLEDWCPPFPGYHLYYPSRRHFSPALSAPRRRAALSGLMSRPEPDRVGDPALGRRSDPKPEAMADACKYAIVDLLFPSAAAR